MKKVAKKRTRNPRVAPSPAAEWVPPPVEVEPAESAKDFQADGEKRNRLLAILRDPVFKNALAVLKDELTPRGDLKIFLESNEISSARYHQFAGMTYFLDGLKRLTKEPVEPKTLQGKRLTTQLPD